MIISDSISIREFLLGLYDTISDSISIRDNLLGLYDKISDAQPEGQGHSINIRDNLFIAMLCVLRNERDSYDKILDLMIIY